MCVRSPCFWTSSTYYWKSVAFRFAISSTKILRLVWPSSTSRHSRVFRGNQYMMTGICYHSMSFLPHCLSFHLEYLNKMFLPRSVYRLVLLTMLLLILKPYILMIGLQRDLKLPGFAVPCTVSARTQKFVLRLVQNTGVDGQRCLLLSHYLLPQHYHLLWSGLPTWWPDCWYGCYGYNYVQLHHLGRQLPDCSDNVSLYMDSALLYLGEYCNVVPISLTLRHVETKFLRKCVPDSSWSPRSCTNILDSHPVSYNCL